MFCAANMDQPKKEIKAVLKQIYGEKSNEIYKLSAPEVMIGRSPKCQIRLQTPSISRQHCVLTYSDNGWIVKDKKSQNGTYVNGRQLKPEENYLLEDGDILFLGPPSELPQAFSYEQSYSSAENLEEMEMSVDDISIDDIIELPLKRPYEYDVESSPEKSAKKTDNKPEKQLKPLGNNSNSSPSHSPCKDLPKTSVRKPRKTAKNCKAPKDITVKPLSHISSHNSEPLVSASSSKNTDYTSQIYEISSTGSDHLEDSESLLNIGSEVASSSVSQRSTEEFKESEVKAANGKEKDLQLALLAEQIKALQASKLELLKNYEEVCEKNKKLDQELAKKEIKLKEDLQKHEIKAKNELKSELLEKFEEDLVCNICTELFIKPTVLDCSHTFCEYCIKEWKKKKNDCPICRCKIKNVTRVRTLEEFIDKTLATLTPEQREKRNVIVAERIRAEQPPPKSPAVSRRRRNSRHRPRIPRAVIGSRTNEPVLMATGTNDTSIQILEESSGSRPRSSYINVQVPSTEDLNLHVNLPVLDIPMLRFFFS